MAVIDMSIQIQKLQAHIPVQWIVRMERHTQRQIPAQCVGWTLQL